MMKSKPFGQNVDKGTRGTTWKAGSRIGRTLAAIGLAGALALGVVGITAHHATPSAAPTQVAAKFAMEAFGSTWS